MPPSRTLTDALAASPAGAALLQRLAETRRFAELLSEDPSLRMSGIDPRRPGFLELRGATLRLAARSSAEAAKLRQSLPRLRQTLLQHGFESIEFLVAVQPMQNAYPVPASTENSRESAADYSEDTRLLSGRRKAISSFLEKLAVTLENPLLLSTVHRLSGVMRERDARMREQIDPENVVGNSSPRSSKGRSSPD